MDDAGQMVFLEAELARARAARSIAHIICHVPPGYQSETGNPLLVPAFNDRFLSLLEDHKDVVKAVFAGHEHKDTTRLLANRLYTGFLDLPSPQRAGHALGRRLSGHSTSKDVGRPHDRRRGHRPSRRAGRHRIPSSPDHHQQQKEQATPPPMKAAPELQPNVNV